MTERILVPAVLLHVPYVRRAGAWPFGEHQLHRLVGEVLVPLLLLLRRASPGVRLSLAVSPVLVEQLADRETLLGVGQAVRRRWEAFRDMPAGLPEEGRAAWHWQRDRAGALEEAWFSALGQQPLVALAALQNEGHVELLATPATAAILPLAPRPSAARLQLLLARRVFDERFGAAPEGLWSPGGAWATEADRGWSLEEIALEAGFGHVLCSARGWVDEADGVGSREPFGPAEGPLGLRHLAPPDSFMAACLDPVTGFPGDGAYLGAREAMPSSVVSTEPLLARGAADGAELGASLAPYVPELAYSVAERHATSALGLAGRLLDAAVARHGRKACLLLPVEADRFLSWPEGLSWLEQVLRRAPEAGLELGSSGEVAAWAPDRRLSAVLPSSWDRTGSLSPWQPANSGWYWQQVGLVADHAESLVTHRGGDGRPLMLRALAQAQREALLLASGEWPRMVGVGGASADYAAARIRDHLDRFRRLADMVDAGTPDESLLERYEGLDNAFGSLDPTLLHGLPRLSALQEDD
ncbi:MAG: 1,4-alpha-glucan branching protein domain-containing protein [Candidatus Sericytochromatia bacterium]|nr:1,4-alpha-glucan branching protein domain-containing protein [Candidatus Sericytochromatia bacterium]